MCRKAVHEQRARLCQRHQRIVHLIRAERAPPDVGLRLLAHGRPRIRVHGVGTGDGVGGLAEQPEARAVPGDACRLLHDGMRQLVAFRARDVNVDAQHGAGVRERRRDVVAVADERDRTAAYRSPTLLKRQEVGDRLTRMLLVSQRVDDVQAFGGRRELPQQLLRERPDHDRIDPALEVPGDIGRPVRARQGRRRAAAPARGRRVRARRSRTSNGCEATACERAAPRACRRAHRPWAPGGPACVRLSPAR